MVIFWNRLQKYYKILLKLVSISKKMHFFVFFLHFCSVSSSAPRKDVLISPKGSNDCSAYDLRGMLLTIHVVVIVDLYLQCLMDQNWPMDHLLLKNTHPHMYVCEFYYKGWSNGQFGPLTSYLQSPIFRKIRTNSSIIPCKFCTL